MSIQENLQKIKATLPSEVSLVAVSKTKPNEAILEAYEAGQRIFGENRVQELAAKAEVLPKDIEWHQIGHLQTNKVKYIAPFVAMIHAVDSMKLLVEIDKRAAQNGRIINCLLQLHIAEEESKFGLSFEDVKELLQSEEFKNLQSIRVVGLMGMATFTDDEAQVKQEFTNLKTYFDALSNEIPESQNFQCTTLSMGMSGDYQLAIECGSNMVRVGSAIFGSR
jgi:pyridoxal phosphate enzyme (YggS family)